MNRFAALTLLIGLIAVPARARERVPPGFLGEPEMTVSPDGRNEVAVGVGAFHSTAKFGYRGLAGDKGERFGSTGFLWTLDYLRALNKAFAVGGEFGYVNRGDQNITNTVVGTPSATKVRGDSMLLMAVARLRSPGLGWRPYVIGGAGFHQTHFDIFGLVPGFTETPVVRGDSTGLALMGRAGLEYAWPRGGFAGFEAGYLHTDTKVYQPTAAGVAGGFNNVSAAGDGFSYLLRLGIRFGAGS